MYKNIRAHSLLDYGVPFLCSKKKSTVFEYDMTGKSSQNPGLTRMLQKVRGDVKRIW